MSFSESLDIDIVLCTGSLNKSNKNKGLSCILKGEPYFPFTKQTWVDDSGSSCHLNNDDSGIHYVTIISDITGMIDKKTLVRTTKMGQRDT